MNTRRIVFYWLLLGCLMVFVQVVVGGITRLTGSGLSITKWEIVMGTLPPLDAVDWEEAFSAYKKTPQYALINQDMTMDEFQFIYFWEWIHRFWARWMGVVFLLPFLFFWHKQWIRPELRYKLLIVFGWAALIASFGWIMVASGLIDKPYVSPVKLSLHLSLAIGLLGYLVWLTTGVVLENTESSNLPASGRSWLTALTFVAGLQIFLGGIFSGTKAGLMYPTWPDMHGEWVPTVLTDMPASWKGFLYYDAGDAYAQAFIQFIHRGNGYLLLLLSVLFWFAFRKQSLSPLSKKAILLMPVTVSLQALIGLLTVLHCNGKIPVFWGVLHQIGAMLLVSTLAVLWYVLGKKSTS